MKKITSTAELKNTILLLEERQAVQGRLLKKQFLSVCEGLRPGNIAKNLFNRFSSSTDLKIGITAAAVSLAAFYFAKKAIVRSTQQPFKKLLGTLIGVSISNLIASHPGAVKSIGQILFQRVFNKKQN